jgi:hypothetical protein
MSCVIRLSFLAQAELHRLNQSQVEATAAEQQRTKEIEQQVELERKAAQEAIALAQRERQEKETERKRAEEAAAMAKRERQEKEAERKRAEEAERVAKAARATSSSSAKPKLKRVEMSSSSSDSCSSDDSSSEDSDTSDSDSDSDVDSIAVTKATAVVSTAGRAKFATSSCAIVIDDDDEEDCVPLAGVARAKRAAASVKSAAGAAAGGAANARSAKSQGKNMFVVERILDHRYPKIHNEMEFLIKWKGYDRDEDNTWEPENAFKEPQMVKAYLKEQEQKLAAQKKAEDDKVKANEKPMPAEQAATQRLVVETPKIPKIKSTTLSVFGCLPSPSTKSVEAHSAGSINTSKNSITALSKIDRPDTARIIQTAKRSVSFAPSVPIASVTAVAATTSGSSNIGASDAAATAMPTAGRPNTIVPILPKSAARPATSTSLLALTVAPSSIVSSVGGAHIGPTEYSYLKRFRDEFAGVLSEQIATGATRNFRFKCELCNFSYVDTLDMTYMTQRMEVPRWTDHKLPLLLPHLMEKHRLDHRFMETLRKLHFSYGLVPCSHCPLVVKDLSEHMSAKHPVVIEGEVKVPVPSLPAVPSDPVAVSQAPLSAAFSHLPIVTLSQSAHSVEAKSDVGGNAGSTGATATSASVVSNSTSVAAKLTQCPFPACKSKFSTERAALQHHADKHKTALAATANSGLLAKRKDANEPHSTTTLLPSDTSAPASKKTRIATDNRPITTSSFTTTAGATSTVLPAALAPGIASVPRPAPVQRVHVCASSSKCQLPYHVIPPNPSPDLWRVEDLTMVRHN